MKVTGTGGIGPAGAPRQARSGGGEGFRIGSPAGAAGPGSTSSVTAAAGVVGVEALLALQDVGGPLERRRRAIGRATRILDVLDGIKIALLDGELDARDLDRLRQALREERAQTADPALEAVLDEIETRAAVEAAKLEQNARAI